MHVLEEKINFKKQILENVAHKKITFWFNLPRRYRIFWVLRAILKNHDPEEEVFPKKHDFERKIFYLVRFGINFFTTRHVLNWIYTTRQLFKRNIFLKSLILKKKKFFRRHDFEEKINFKKQILKKILRTKNNILIQFTP